MERNLNVSLPHEILKVKSIQDVKNELANDYSLNMFNLDHETTIVEYLSSISSGETDLFFCDMSSLPIDLPDNVTIAAVCPREEVNDVILIKEKAHDDIQLLQLKSDSNIVVTSSLQQAFFNKFTPQLQVKKILGYSLIDFINSEEQVAVFPQYQVEAENLNDSYTINPLHYREFIPTAGQGIITILIRNEDMELRRLLQKLGDIETAYISIVERTILKNIRNESERPLSVYVHKDGKSFYHAHASILDEQDQIHQVSLSQSTTSGLAEVLSKELLNKIK